VRSCYSVALGALLSVVASIPARAETDLTGKWIGQFIGVQIEMPPERGPFGYPLGEGKGAQAPQVRRKPPGTRYRHPEERIGRGYLDGRRVQKALRLRANQSDYLELYRFWRPRQRRDDLAN
jgi:hypothetical protein